MREDSLDIPPATLASPQPRPVSSQFVIEMQDTTAARLIVRSMLELLSQMATSLSDSAETASVARPEGWRLATHRVSACVGLYAEPLQGSLARKSRRRLRALARHAERVRRTGVQLTWLDRILRAAPSMNGASSEIPDDIAAAAWLRRRVLRRQSGLAVSAKRANRDAAKLRSLAKSLGTYTTDVSLDDMPLPRSFSNFTAELLRTETERARKNLDVVRPNNTRSVSRALDSVRRIGYLLEPVRVHMRDIGAVSERLRELEASLERLSELGAVATMMLRAGRRAGALHMTSLLRAELFDLTEHDADRARQSDDEAPARDFRPGLMALARQLNAEIAPAFEWFAGYWDKERIGKIAADLEAGAEQLA